MKVRDSGMPEEAMWSKFFNVENILDKLQVNNSVSNLVEVGCGYGTFTISAANRINGKLFAFDIEQQMIDHTNAKAEIDNISNIEYLNRDILLSGTGLEPGTIDYVMLFNILHHSNPLDLFDEAYKILKIGGKTGIIHWRTDIETPRGPDISIRPTPEQCMEWAEKSGFNILISPIILEPYHYGLLIEKRLEK